MIRINNFVGSNDNIKIVEQKGIFTVFEHIKDLSVSPHEAQLKYYMEKMSCEQRQVLIDLQNNAVRLAPGAMQIMLGNVQSDSGVTGVGDLFNKALKSKATGNTAIKPVYRGTGKVITEATYQHFIVEDVADWGGAIVCDDGMFVCCDDELKDTVVMRSNFSSAVAGGEGLFNLCLRGQGVAVLKAPCPREEMYEIYLENDVVKIDGNNAICWSNSLDFTVERSGRSLVGSAASGEGLVNVYRGTGRILVTPLRPSTARIGFNL